MDQMKRYAVYYAPRAGAFADAAAAWLGWDAGDGRGRATARCAGALAIRPAITAEPRRYGFHGTMKPPFRLAEGIASDRELHARWQPCAARLAPVTLRRAGAARICTASWP